MSTSQRPGSHRKAFTSAGLVTRCMAGVVVAILGVLVASAPAADAEAVAIFHVGNSLTDQAYGMHDVAEARGHETRFGRHMIPGAPLDWLWNHREEGFRAPGGKKAADAILREGEWDVLILQPYGRAPEKSIEFGANYAAAAYEGNPDCRVYVFANYPGIGKDQSEGDRWVERWLAPDFRRGRANFEKVAAGSRCLLLDAVPGARYSLGGRTFKVGKEGVLALEKLPAGPVTIRVVGTGGP